MLPGRGLKEGPYVTEEELLAMADTAADEEVIEREERKLIHSIIDFGDTVAREVMVPRPDMVTVASAATVRDAADIASTAGFSRIPVYGQGIDDIVGVVYVKDMMRAEREGKADEPVTLVMRQAQFVPESKRVAEVMREMQAGKQHLAIVVDEYGGTAGLITLEDVLEELVGEISDEYDVDRPRLQYLDGGRLQVDGAPVDRRDQRADRLRTAPRRLGHRGRSSLPSPRSCARGGGGRRLQRPPARRPESRRPAHRPGPDRAGVPARPRRRRRRPDEDRAVALRRLCPK